MRSNTPRTTGPRDAPWNLGDRQPVDRVHCIVEYFIAVNLHGQWALLLAALLVAAVAKAWFIVRDFMHVAQIWGGEHH
ncbi:MAG: hypothetical protein IPJ58_02450 [Ardenticatenia bacterium]|nr:hypothetical protein [Ardenticatenia bacterium]